MHLQCSDRHPRRRSFPAGVKLGGLGKSVRLRFERLEDRTMLAAIDVGQHVLLENTPGQTIEISVIPGDPVEEVAGMNLFAQIGDGGPDLPPPYTGAIDGPEFTDCDVTTGTIWTIDPHPTEPAYLPGRQVVVAGIIVGVPQAGVPADGLLATLTVDTTGFFADHPNNPWELKLTDTLDPDGMLLLDNGAPLPTPIALDITNGWITLFPPDPQDDVHEPNDSLDDATECVDQDVEGVQLDDDWYEICVDFATPELLTIDVGPPPGGEKGNGTKISIDAELYDSSGNLLAYSRGATNTEHIEYVAAAGENKYYVKVYGGDFGAAYSLRWGTGLLSLQWDELGDGDWGSDPSRWVFPGPSDPGAVMIPNCTTDALLRTDRVTVAEDRQARNLQIESGTLAVAAQAGLDLCGDLDISAPVHYQSQIAADDPANGLPDNGLIEAQGSARLDGWLELEAVEYLLDFSDAGLYVPGEWPGDQTRTVLSAAEILGEFAHVPPSAIIDPDPLDPVQGHLGKGVFLTDQGANCRGVSYHLDPLGPDEVRVDVFQAAPGDVNGDRKINSFDIQRILSCDTYPDRRPADWTCGDFNGDGWCNGLDVQMILATDFFNKGIYAPPVCPTPGPAGTAEAAARHAVFAHLADDRQQRRQTRSPRLAWVYQAEQAYARAEKRCQEPFWEADAPVLGAKTLL